MPIRYDKPRPIPDPYQETFLPIINDIYQDAHSNHPSDPPFHATTTYQVTTNSFPSARYPPLFCILLLLLLSLLGRYYGCRLCLAIATLSSMQLHALLLAHLRAPCPSSPWIGPMHCWVSVYRLFPSCLLSVSCFKGYPFTCVSLCYDTPPSRIASGDTVILRERDTSFEEEEEERLVRSELWSGVSPFSLCLKQHHMRASPWMKPRRVEWVYMLTIVSWRIKPPWHMREECQHSEAAQCFCLMNVMVSCLLPSSHLSLTTPTASLKRNACTIKKDR
ncbi:hypothetical protein BDW02DRAFT_392391 [Decorospora gaudefroyi]|uniref:Uncharacterized protein n=1 Tax=Decorospora gaudefroyi TaxID=184978 RepID=A0A6A5KR33_9PLEO|nr:hypothetical protein BDW02DRAFT_392391 [Decorospora gaudefroyi]